MKPELLPPCLWLLFTKGLLRTWQQHPHPSQATWTSNHTATSLIARFMGSWGPPGADRAQVGPILAHELCYLGWFIRDHPFCLCASKCQQFEAYGDFKKKKRKDKKCHQGINIEAATAGIYLIPRNWGVFMCPAGTILPLVLRILHTRQRCMCYRSTLTTLPLSFYYCPTCSKGQHYPCIFEFLFLEKLSLKYLFLLKYHVASFLQHNHFHDNLCMWHC